MLQVYALLSGLLLSMVGACIFEDFDKFNKATEIYGALFGSLELLFLLVVIIVCLYLYLMRFVTQEKRQDLLAEKQAHSWWVSGGRWIFVGLPILVLYSSWLFRMAVTMYFECKFDTLGDGPFDYGCMKHWLTLPIVAFLAFTTIHKSFHTAGWVEDQNGHMAIPESMSEDSCSEDSS
ncbi:unnamed protein product [Prorocentrum cordatum]|uniref:Uncharacterized protein n=1 Tax=Prorocentrum cordatum TaxID=2364126 RepID=A0ABN9QUZ3_9DINO|nr:unnamed protein product [Polarella glacialis]